MSSLLHKLKGHSSDKRQYDGTRDASYNHQSSPTGYESTNQGGYGDTNSPNHNTTADYDNGQLNAHSDGGRYHAPRGTAVGQGRNTHTVGPHNSSVLNKADPRVDSDQSKLHHGIQQNYGGPDSNQSGHNSNREDYGNDQQGYDSRRGGYDDDQGGYGTTTTTTTNTSTSIEHGQVGSEQGVMHDSNKRLPADPQHPSMKERLDPRVDTDSSRRNDGYGSTNYGNDTGAGQYDHDTNKRLPRDPNAPTTLEKANPKVDTDGFDRREGHNTTGYGNNPGNHQYGTTNASSEYGTTGYDNTTGSDQYNHDSSKRLPKNPEAPTMLERANPGVITGTPRNNDKYGNTGYNNTTGSDQYGQQSEKRLPKNPEAPTTLERMNPNVTTNSPRRSEIDTTGYGNTSSATADSRRHRNDNQYAAGAAGAYGSTDSSRHHAQPVHNDDSMLNRSHPVTSMHPSDRRYDSSRSDHQTGPDGEYLTGPAPTTAGPHKSDLLNKLDPRVDSDQSKLEKEREREREGYGSDSRHHGSSAAGYDGIGNNTQSDNRSYDPNGGDQRTGAFGSDTAGPHSSSLNNRLDPRVDSDQSRLDRERDREAYGSKPHHHHGTGAGVGSTASSDKLYGSEHERRINEGHHDRHREGNDIGTGHGDRRSDQYSSNSPNINRDSGYGDQGTTVSSLPHRKPVNESGSYGNDQYNRGNDYDRSNPAGTYNNAAATNSNRYDDDENDFECAKCGHKNTHLRKNNGGQYGQQKAGFMDKLNPRTDTTGDGNAGFMK